MKCPVCWSLSGVRRRRRQGAYLYTCPRCGPFTIGNDAETYLLEQAADLPTPTLMLSVKIRRLGWSKEPPEITRPIADRLVASRRQPPPAAEPEEALRWLGRGRRHGGAPVQMSLAGWAAVMSIPDEREAELAIRRLEQKGLITATAQDDKWLLAPTVEGDELLQQFKDDFDETPSEIRYPLSHQTPLLYELKIRCFRSFVDEQRLIFCEEGRVWPSRWTVLIGENGVGKTTILKLVAALYPYYIGDEYRHSSFELLGGDADFTKSLLSVAPNEGGNLSIIECKYLIPVDGAIGHPIITAAVRSLGGGRSSYMDELLVELSSITYMGGRNGYNLVTGHGELLARPPMIAGYGASRYIGGSRLAPTDDKAHSAVRSLFEDDRPLKNPEEWLLQADYSARFVSSKNGDAARRLERIKTALVRLLPGISGVSVAAPDDRHDAPFVLFESPFASVDLSGLSFGYQSTIAWVVDFAARLFDHYGELENPLEGGALVLLDEIDIHAHPKWQRKMMQHLQDVFPNTQFVTTTHSPVVIQGSGDVNIALLQATDTGIKIVNDLDRIKEWRVDQILTSDLFGLDSAAPDYIKEMEKRRVELLKKDRLTDDETSELDVIEEALSRLPLSADPAAERARRLILDFAARVEGS